MLITSGPGLRLAHFYSCSELTIKLHLDYLIAVHERPAAVLRPSCGFQLFF